MPTPRMPHAGVLGVFLGFALSAFPAGRVALASSLPASVQASIPRLCATKTVAPRAAPAAPQAGGKQ